MRKFIDKYFLYLPMILVEIYLLFTVVLYEFGPLNWQTQNKTLFYVLLAAYHIAFIGGYLLSVKKIPIKKSVFTISSLSDKHYQILVWSMLVLAAFCTCVEYKNVTHASSYIPYELPKNLINGLINPAEQYYNKFTADSTGSTKGVTLLASLFAFIYISIIPFLVAQWKRINLAQKICFFFLIIFKLSIYVSVGTNKGIFDTMFYFLGILIVLLLLNFIHKTDKFITKKTFIQVSAFALCLVIFSFSYFTATISSRVKDPVEYAISNTSSSLSQSETSSSTESSAPESSAPESSAVDSSAPESSAPESSATDSSAPTSSNTTSSTTSSESDKTDPPAVKKPSFIKRMYYSVTNYVVQGYYGMSLSLDEEFTSTYGFGNSAFLTKNLKDFFGVDVSEKTYQHKITEDWHESQKWHSFYSYIANDVSFYGVIVVMFLIGIFFGMICKDVLLHNSLVGTMILMLFIIMFMYMPANNQVFTAATTFMAFFELSFIWLISKFNFKKG